MKILVLAKSVDGGTGTFLTYFTNLKSRYAGKADIEIIALEEPAFRKADFTASYIHPKRHYPDTYKFDLSSVVSFLREWREVGRRVASAKPQVILSVDLHSNLLALLTQIFPGNKVPVIASTHIYLDETLGSKASPVLRSFLAVVIRMLYNRADVLVAVSEGVRDDLVNHFRIKNKIHLIHNGIKLRNINPIKPRSPRRILTVGRLVEQKDYETLLQAFALVVKKVPDASLTIVGEGPLRKKLEKTVRNRSLRERVCFTGWVHDCGPYFRTSDVFVLSSRREGFPYVLLEAMNYGLPVVSSDAPYGPREILGENIYGLLIPVGDAERLARGLVRLLADDKAYGRYCAKARERVAAFSLDRMLRRYKTVIDRVIIR